MGRLIQVLKSDEETFWTFTMLLEKILPFDYYIQMMGVSADVKYFGEELLKTYLPEVHAKFKDLNFNPSFFSFNWFTCLFQDKLSDAVSDSFITLKALLCNFGPAFHRGQSHLAASGPHHLLYDPGKNLSMLGLPRALRSYGGTHDRHWRGPHASIPQLHHLRW